MTNHFTPTPIEPNETTGWVDSMKSSLSNFITSMTESKAVIAETLAYFAAGFAVGFLAKRYLRQLFIVIVVSIIVIKGLEYAGVGTVALNWSRVKELTGVSTTDTLGAVAQAYLAWLQMHIRQTVAVVVGFLVGTKVG